MDWHEIVSNFEGLSNGSFPCQNQKVGFPATGAVPIGANVATWWKAEGPLSEER